MTGTGVTVVTKYNNGLYSLWIDTGASVTISDVNGAWARDGKITIDGTLTVNASCTLGSMYGSLLRVKTTGLLTGAGVCRSMYATAGSGIDIMDGVCDIATLRLERWTNTAVLAGGIYNPDILQFSTTGGAPVFKLSDTTYVFDCATMVELYAYSANTLTIDNTNGARIFLPAGGIVVNDAAGTVVWLEE